LGPLAAQLDTIFQHRVQRLVRKDGTVSYEGRFFEVPYELTGKMVWLLVDPHTHSATGVEDGAGTCLGAVTLLYALANRHRRRRKPTPAPAVNLTDPMARSTTSTLVDLAYEQHYGPIAHQPSAVSRQQMIPTRWSNNMYREHFGLRHAPLGKDTAQLWDDGALAQLRERQHGPRPADRFDPQSLWWQHGRRIASLSWKTPVK
jgi:hypothetical protein